MSCKQILRQCSKLSVTWARHASSSSSVVTQSTEVNKNLKIFHHTTHREDPRPIVLLFGWLLAKPEHLKKFIDFYLAQGFDVMSIRVYVGQLLRPKRVQSLMKHVLDLCHEDHRKHQPIICHGFSVGGYLYGEVLNMLMDHSHKYEDFGERVFGQIFDSPVDFYGIPNGIARAVTSDRKKAMKIESTLEWYMEKFQNITRDYIRSSQTFQSNSLKTRSLFLYSLSDPVCNPEHIEQIARNWRSSGIEAETVFWEKAPHVTSFKMYPKEYKYIVKDFLWRTGVPGHQIARDDLDFQEREEADLLAQRNVSMAFA